MTRIPSLVFAAIVACVGIFAAHDASAFCVYNNIAKKKIFAMQLGKLKGFSGTISPGDKACCNYKNNDCNKGGNREKMLDMETRVEIKKGSSLVAKLQAGGYWVFKDNPKFDKSSKKFGWQNPPYILESYTYDHKLLNTYNCPPQQKGKPGLMDFVG
jgi:hypothetical protein